MNKSVHIRMKGMRLWRGGVCTTGSQWAVVSGGHVVAVVLRLAVISQQCWTLCITPGISAHTCRVILWGVFLCADLQHAFRQ